MNRLASMATPLSRGPTIKHADFAFTHSASSSQARHSPSTQPRSFDLKKMLPLHIANKHLLPQLLPLLLMVQAFLLQLREGYDGICHPIDLSTPTVMTSFSYPSTTLVLLLYRHRQQRTNGRFSPHIPWGLYARSLSRKDLREGGHAWGRLVLSGPLLLHGMYEFYFFISKCIL